MKKFTYSDKKRREISFPLGGIGTGFFTLLGNGALGNFEIKNRLDKNSASKSFFAIKAEKDGVLTDARILWYDDEFSGMDNEAGTDDFPRFTKCDFTSYFPFAELNFSCEKFPAGIKMTAFNPFIPLNDTDSGIPAGFFEFEVTNDSSETFDYTICGVLENLLPSCHNKAGCTDSGEAYICMDSEKSLSKSKYGNMCLSTDAKNISFKEHLFGTSWSDTGRMFWNDFTLYHTFTDRPDTSIGDEEGCGVLAGHFTLKSGESKIIRFLISWYFPYYENCNFALSKDEGESNEEYDITNSHRNYYAQYFESSLECASYCYRHWDRLKNESLRFSELLLGSTLPEEILEAISTNLCVIKSSIHTRTEDGSLKDLTLGNYALPFLFPHLERSTTSKRLKKLFEEEVNGNESGVLSDSTLQLLIISSYRSFLLNGDEDELIENWYYISKALDFCIENGNSSGYEYLFAVALKSGYEMAMVVKDKKRAEVYLKLLNCIINTPSASNENQISAQFHAELLGFGEFFKGTDFNSTETCDWDNSQAATLMLMHGNVKEALEVIKSANSHKDNEAALSSYGLLNAMCGFEYDALGKHIGFRPLSDYCPLEWGGTFKCFFCVEQGYGFVEEGIDYIEINMVYGKLDIRSFAVPRIPRLVQYGGRNWKFTDTGLCATLDTNLEVYPGKKLTILIDIKQQNKE